MVFKSFAAIARNTALAKSLFVASTATSAQPAFFVSTQQLARQQATTQAQQLLVRGIQHPFSSAEPGANGNHPHSANGATFPSYGTNYSSVSLSVSTSSTSDDDKRRNTDLSIYSSYSPLSSLASQSHIPSSGQHVRLLHISAGSRKQITEDGEPLDLVDQQFELLDVSGIPPHERLIEVDDETAATILAQSTQVRAETISSLQPPSQNHVQAQQQQLQQVQLYSYSTQRQTVEPPPSLDLKTTDEFVPESDIKQNIEPAVSTLSSASSSEESSRVIDYLYSIQNWSGVISHYDLMKASSTIPSLSSYNKVLISSAKSGLSISNMGYLLEIYAKMLSQQIVPDVSTYSIVITSLTARFMASQRTLSQDLIPAKNRIIASQIQPINDFLIMFQSVSSDPSLNLALDVFFASVSVKQQDYDISVYNALLEACAEVGRVDVIPQILNILHLNPGMVKFNANTYKFLIRGFGEANRLKNVSEIFKLYKEQGLPSLNEQELEIYEEVLRAYFKCNSSEAAINFFENILTDVPEYGGRLLNTCIEGLLINDHYETAWKWLQRASMQWHEPTLDYSFAIMLSAASKVGDLRVADNIYKSCVDVVPNNALWRNALSDYLAILVKEKQLSQVMDVLQSKFSNVILDFHSIKDVALFVVHNVESTDNMILDIFKFVDNQVGLYDWQPESDDFVIYSRVIEDLLTKMLSTSDVHRESLLYTSGITNSLLSILAQIQFEAIITPAVADDPATSILGRVFLRHASEVADGISPVENIRNLVFLHAKYVVSESRNRSPLFDLVAQHLQGLIDLVMRNRIVLSKDERYFVDLALPLIGGFIADSWFRSTRPQQILPEQVFPQYENAVVDPTSQYSALGEYLKDIPLRVATHGRIFDLLEERKLQQDLLQYDVQSSRELVRLLYIDAPYTYLSQVISQTYDQGRTLSPAAIVKFVEWCGIHQRPVEAEELYRLAEATIPPVQFQPALALTWSSIYNAMIGMYFRCESRDTYVFRAEVEDLKRRMNEMGLYPDANAYANMIMKLNCADPSKEADLAVKLFSESTSYGVMPTTFLYNVLLSKLSKARRLPNVLAYFKEMSTLGVKCSSVTYGTVITACCRANEAELAERMFEEMEAAPDYKPRVAPFNSMIQFYLELETINQNDRLDKLQNKNRALQYFKRMKELNLGPSSRSYLLLIGAFDTIEPTDRLIAQKIRDEMNEGLFTK
ncbi:hypothetical protein V1514DRAFT_338671 [Lipomyces japonicus]|uniref:uncharacterized protein n=1 Tax=Lipomyces japonicus TaxID=56871 RepID=UPI0034CDF418